MNYANLNPRPSLCWLLPDNPPTQIPHVTLRNTGDLSLFFLTDHAITVADRAVQFNFQVFHQTVQSRSILDHRFRLQLFH